jgi:hypothetical protein
VNGGATGFRIVSNTFDNIYAQGIIFGNVALNATGHNIFYDVGNSFNGINSPSFVIVDIQSDNNVSISDLFARPDSAVGTYARIQLNGTTSTATINSREILLGNYVRENGVLTTLADNTSSSTAIFTEGYDKAFAIDYAIERNNAFRTGKIVVAADGVGTLTYTDDYVENTLTGITLTVTQTGSNVSLNYTSTPTGSNAELRYSLNYLATF